MSIENLLKDLRKTIKLPENIGNWKNIFLSYQTEEDYSRNGLELDRPLKSTPNFTINAIAFDPINGAIIDPFGGIPDLKKRLIRAVGNPEQRFAEDGLCAMIAIRLISTLGFDIEEKTELAISDQLLKNVPKEQIRDELIKILAGKYRAKALEIAWDTGLLTSILPHNVNWPNAIEDFSSLDDPLTLLAALLHEIEADEVSRYLDNLKFTIKDKDHVLSLHKNISFLKLRLHNPVTGADNEDS